MDGGENGVVECGVAGESGIVGECGVVGGGERCVSLESLHRRISDLEREMEALREENCFLHSKVPDQDSLLSKTSEWKVVN